MKAETQLWIIGGLVALFVIWTAYSQIVMPAFSAARERLDAVAVQS